MSAKKAGSTMEVGELSIDQERSLLDREARRALNIDADEFERRWNSGDYADCDDPRVTEIAMMLPGAW